MTETDKANLREALEHDCPNRLNRAVKHNCIVCNYAFATVLAYGAAQYEAGAASMARDIEKKLDEVGGALPLREKD